MYERGDHLGEDDDIHLLREASRVRPSGRRNRCRLSFSVTEVRALRGSTSPDEADSPTTTSTYQGAEVL
jgi:hypothetical protein